MEKWSLTKIGWLKGKFEDNPITIGGRGSRAGQS